MKICPEIGGPVFYSKFVETKYVQNVHYKVNDKERVIPVLYVNLPYEYFSTQVKKIDSITDDMKDKIKKHQKDCFLPNMYCRINHGKLYPANSDVTTVFEVATYLKIPVVPAVLCIFDDIDYQEDNQTMNDVILNIINGICSPYFSFTESSNTFIKDQYTEAELESERIATLDNTKLVDELLKQENEKLNAEINSVVESFKREIGSE